MLSKKKIKIMFHMASYENGIGRKDLQTVKFYKNDYVRYNMLKSVVCFTMAYALILSLIALYNLEYIIKNAVILDYKSLGLTTLGVYLLFVGIYMFVSIIFYSVRYEASKKRVKKYYRYLKYLRKYYQTDTKTDVEGQ